MINKIILLLFFTFYANAVLITDEKILFEDFGIEYYNDKKSELTINEIEKSDNFNKINSGFALGYKTGTIWLKINVENKSSQKDLILSINEHFYEIANLYTYDFNSKLWKVYENGVFFPLVKRPIVDTKLSFKLNLEKNSKQVYYLELQGKYSYFGNLTISKEKNNQINKYLSSDIIFIVIFGIAITIFMYTLFIYIQLKENIYLYYFLYVALYIVYLVNISGLLAYFDLQNYMYKLHFLVAFCMGFFVLFSLEYLRVKKYLKKIDLFLKFLVFCLFIVGLLNFYSYTPWNQVINNLISLSNILLIFIAIRIFFMGKYFVGYYLLILLTYFFLILFFTCMISGLIEYTQLNRFAYIVFSGFELIFFTLLLASRYNEMKNRQIKMQKELIALRNNQKEILEKKVSLKTEKLLEVNKKLTTLVNEKELLLKEVFHRVKNNFHTIIGIVWIEGQKYKNKEAFENIITRIKSISTIHEYLYQSKDLTEVNLNEYFESILLNLQKTNENVNLKIDISQISINFEHLCFLGNIVNEVITNAIKHNKNKEDLLIYLKIEKKNEVIHLTIKDNGKGLEANFENKQTLGISLIKEFVSKLPNSKYKLEDDENGVIFLLEFFY